MKNVNYYLGNLVRMSGYSIRPRWREPLVHGDLFELGIRLALSAEPEAYLNVVQIGGFDGTTSDPIRGFMASERIRATIFEPQEVPFGRLQSLYGHNPRVRLVRAAVGECDGTAKLYLPGTGNASPMASLSPAHCRKFGSSDDWRCIEVPSVSIRTVLQHYWSEAPVFLQVDAEGMDWPIVSALLRLGARPSLINFESMHLSRLHRDEARDVLRAMGYSFWEQGLDTFCIHSELLGTRAG